MKGKIIWFMVSLLASSLGLAGVQDWKTNETNTIETFEKVEQEMSGELFAIIEEKEVEDPTANDIVVESTMPYYIRINRLQNVVNIYEKKENDTYTPYRVMVCSTGEATPENGAVHQVTNERYRWSWLSGGVYGQYVTNIVGGIYFHSVPYTKISNDALEYWEYDKLGTTASLGCIRLTTEDAKWVYENIAKGTTVEFYEDEHPGPFGKPEAQKITENEANRGWDPTDEVEGNPWRR